MTQLRTPQHIGGESPAKIREDLAADFLECEADINRTDIEHHADGTHAVVHADEVVVSLGLTLGGVFRATWEAVSGSVGSLGQVLLNGAQAAKINVGEVLQIQSNAGTKSHLEIDEKKGLMGFVGDIMRPSLDIDFSRLVKTPFYADDFTISTAAAPVADYPSLRTCQITLSAGAKSFIAAGQYAEIGGIYYPITAVVGAVVTLEYPFDDADPVAGAVLFNQWYFQGTYAGKVNYSRAERVNFFDFEAGIMRTASVGFPAIGNDIDYRYGLERYLGTLNALPVLNWRSAAYFVAATGAATIADAGVGIDGVGTAIAITDNSTILNESVRPAAITIPADTATHVIGIAIMKATTALSNPICRLQLSMSGGNTQFISIVIDPFSGELSSASSAASKVKDCGSFWWVTIYGTNDGTNTALKLLFNPAIRSTINSATDAAVTGSNTIDYPVMVLNASSIAAPSLPQLITQPDGITYDAANNDVKHGDMTMVFDYQIGALSQTGTDTLMAGSDASFYCKIGNAGVLGRQVSLHSTASLAAGAGILGQDERLVLRSSSGIQSAHVNGELVAESPIVQSGVANTEISIGHAATGAGVDGFSGRLYRLRAYRFALSDTATGAA